MVSQGQRQFEGFPNEDSGAQQLSCSTMNTDDDRQTDHSRGLQTDKDVSSVGQSAEKHENASTVMELNETRNVYMVPVSSQEIPVTSTAVMSSNIVYTRATHTEDPTVVSSLQRQSKMSHLALDSESQLLLSGVQSIPEQVPLILTEGDAEDHESLTVMSGNEHLQAVSTQAVLGGNPSTATGGLMVFSSNDISPTGQLIPINGTNLLVLQSLDSHGQVIHPNQVILNGPAEMLRQSEQAKMVNECKMGNKQYKCPQEGCAKITPTSSKLKLHMLSHTGERPHKCPIDGCEWAFTTAYKLKRHIRGHTGERPFVCDINDCGKCFTTTYNLKTHQKSHVRQQENVCTHDDCGQTFSTLHKLKVHEKKHQVESEIHICAYEGCGKEFKTLSNYNAHYKTHNNERPHVCAYEGCDKRFTKASKLKLHTRTHTGERPYVCEEEGCDWSFTSSYKLKRHMRKHTGERPFACQFAGCGKSFTRASHMRTHALSHTGQKPYVCPLRECRKGFTAASSLNIHMRKHSGDKPFKCDFEGCDKAYTTGANLRLHQKRHEVDKELSQDEEVIEKTGQVTGRTRPIHSVEIGGVNSVVETVASQVPNTPYLVMHTFTGDEFSSEDPSLAVVQFSSEETFPPQTPASTIDSSSGICFQFANTDAYTSTVHGNATSSITGLSFTAGNPLPSPGTHYMQGGEEAEVMEGNTNEAQFMTKCTSDNERYIVDEESSQRVLNTREKEDEDLALPTMVVFTPSSNQTTTVSSQHTTDVVTSRITGNPAPSRSSIGHLTLQRSCENATIDQFAPPAIIFQGEEMKSHENELKLNYTEGKESATSQTSSFIKPSASLTGLSNLNLNLSSLSHEIDKSPGTSFIGDVTDHTLDHESTINLQDLR